MPKRRKYSAECKREAVALANQPGVTKSQIGRELGISPNMITRWQREMGVSRSKAFLGQGVARDEELATLKRELNRIKKERDFFASGNVLRERLEHHSVDVTDRLSKTQYPFSESGPPVGNGARA